MQKAEPKSKRQGDTQLIRIPEQRKQRGSVYLKKITQVLEVVAKETTKMSRKISEKRATPRNFTVKFGNPRD